MQLVKTEPSFIVVNFSVQQQNWIWQSSCECQVVFSNFLGQVKNHFPHDKLIWFAIITSFIFPQIVGSEPIGEALTVLTDGSSLY